MLSFGVMVTTTPSPYTRLTSACPCGWRLWAWPNRETARLTDIQGIPTMLSRTVHDVIVGREIEATQAQLAGFSSVRTFWLQFKANTRRCRRRCCLSGPTSAACQLENSATSAKL